MVHFLGLNVSSGYGITFATEADAQRVARAFRHLKTLCTKDGGLFDSPTQTEKKVTLNIEQTINYINKLFRQTSRIYSSDNKVLRDYSERVMTLKKDYKIHFSSQYTYNGGEFNGSVFYNFDICTIKDMYYSTVRDCIRITTTLDPGQGEGAKLIDKEDNSDYMDYYRSSSLVNDYHLQNKVNYIEIKFGAGTNITEKANRMIKALKHLQALIIAEKKNEVENDPFGN